MAGQSVFKGALGWDDWIWWSGIGGLGLLLLMLILCCVVCVQRAKRKGREEALAAVQARERERQTQEQAQLRYAQAQQARYPARESSYKFSKPEPPQPAYNPYGHDDHGVHRNSYLANAPVPKPKQRRDSQQPYDPSQQAYQQQPQQPYDQQAPPQQGQYYSMPRRDDLQQPPPQPQQTYRYSKPEEPVAPPRLEPEELPQVAAYYGRKPKPQAEPTPPPRPSGPVVSQQYQRQTQVNPNQPPLMQYRKMSARSDTNATSIQEEPLYQTGADVPFVQISSPRGSVASTVSTAYSAAPAVAPSANQATPGAVGRQSGASSVSSTMLRQGGTLRDRIDALRDGSAPGPENFTRISGGSAASVGVPQPAPQRFSSPPKNASPMASAAPAPRRMDVVSGTVLSDASSTENEFARYDNAFDEEAFNTARSNQGLQREDSDRSFGVDSERHNPPVLRDNDNDRRGARGRSGTDDSTGSIEF